MRNINRGTTGRRYMAAYFNNEDDLKGSAAEARLRGFNIYDVFTPYPVHGIDLAVGLKPSRLTWVAFAGGVFGLLLAVGLQTWTSAVDWALNVGGKPFNTVPLWVPVAFELTVLCAGLSVVGALFWICKLFPFRKKMSFKGANDDQFVLVLLDSDSSFSANLANELFEKHNAQMVVEGADL